MKKIQTITTANPAPRLGAAHAALTATTWSTDAAPALVSSACAIRERDLAGFGAAKGHMGLFVADAVLGTNAWSPPVC